MRFCLLHARPRRRTAHYVAFNTTPTSIGKNTGNIELLTENVMFKAEVTKLKAECVVRIEARRNIATFAAALRRAAPPPYPAVRPLSLDRHYCVVLSGIFLL
ncbi:hypothetical protein J6590_060854 [Homalodisca vitripennis]|nr:hypothetical protein J6590_060854 [Homalodisca vitripennis]